MTVRKNLRVWREQGRAMLIFKLFKEQFFNIGRLCFFFVVLGAVTGQAFARDMTFSDISYSYSNCSFTDNGNGTSTVSTVVDYKAIGLLEAFTFMSRGLLIYGYDRNGGQNSSSFIADSVTMNGELFNKRYMGPGYSMYGYDVGLGAKGKEWTKSTRVSARFVAIIPNSKLADWPAVSLQAANTVIGFTSNTAEIKGAVYIARDGSNDGSCKKLVDPESPPPLDITITVTAPDWNLGDLQHGVSDTSFSRLGQLLCFDYSATDVQNRKFIISARNGNGVVSNRYQLRHLSDTSQVVPYSLTLDSGSAHLQLPNNGVELPLDGSNRTCFVPTFKTEVGKTLKEGDYSDVLTFTVTTKP